MKHESSEQQSQSLLCSVAGCPNWWTSDHGRRLCGVHLRNPAPAAKQLPLLTREAARPFTEPEGDNA